MCFTLNKPISCNIPVTRGSKIKHLLTAISAVNSAKRVRSAKAAVMKEKLGCDDMMVDKLKLFIAP